MAGRVIRVVPKTFVTFTPNTVGQAVAAPQAMTQLLARRVDISMWREVTLYARLHTPSIIGAFAPATAGPAVVVYADGFTQEDPSPSVGQPTSGAPNMFLKSILSTNNNFGANTATQVQMLVLALPANAGGLITIALQATSQNPSVQADCYVSIDLSGKE